MQPSIGIALHRDSKGEADDSGPSFEQSTYARAVVRAGGNPVPLCASADRGAAVAHAAAGANELDGLLIPGGGDFLPPVRGAYPADVRFDPVPQAQIAFDRKLLQRARQRRIPVLGICYGMQLMALCRGGTLHHHLPVDLPACAAHQLPEPDGRHPALVAPGTLLAAAVGAGTQSVNSRHHQAVATAGVGLRVAARSSDGVIEAIEAPGEAFCIGIQWHPERLPGPAGEALFSAFIAACATACPAGNT